jgi:flagellar hook-associated protein 1 FlgK
MPNAFTGIELASRALRTFQRGLDVAGHNIANVNTAGYSRQTVDYGATDPTTFFARTIQMMGTGVTIRTVTRAQDLFLQARMGVTQSQIGRFDAAAAKARHVEAIIGEPGPNGISSALDRFFNAWSSLASNPGEPAARLEVQQAGASLADRIRGLHRDFVATDSQLNLEIAGTRQEIDGLTSEIARLNEGIRSQLALGAQPNDLMDQRDMALERLGRLIDVQSHVQEDGSVMVYMGSLNLVDKSGSRPFPTAFDAASYTVNDGSLDHGVRSGRLFGLFEAMNRLNAHKADLDALANSLRAEVNAMHRLGVNPNATTDIPFFAETAIPPTTGAIDFALDAQILADVNNISAGTSGRAGDGGLALSLAQMRDTAIAGLSGRTFSQFYGDIVSTAASQVVSSSADLDTHGAVASQIEAQRQSVRGVSLDDEMAAMLRLQRSYQAAAKALALFDQVTEDLIGLIR